MQSSLRQQIGFRDGRDFKIALNCVKLLLSLRRFFEKFQGFGNDQPVRASIVPPLIMTAALIRAAMLRTQGQGCRKPRVCRFC
jgi:hypothetical protein